MSETTETYAELYGEAFQKHILAVAMRVPGFVLRYRSALDHTYFHTEVSRTVARTLFAHVDEFKQLPTHATLTAAIREHTDKDSVEDCENLLKWAYKDDVSDSDAVMSKAVEFGKQQAMCNAVLESADLIDRGNRRKVLETIQQAQLIGEDLLDTGIDYVDGNRESWYEENKFENAIPTGIAHLDFALEGGLGRGELGVILAPPKRGKSTVLINIGFGALTSLDKLNVLHYSCEMKASKIVMRYDDRLAGHHCKIKNTAREKYLRILDDRARKFLQGRLFVKSYPTRSATVSMLRSHLTLLSSQGVSPDLILVDYGDIMKPERRLGEMRHEQAGIYEDLRALAGEFDAALWTASQAPRGALEKDTLVMSDFAESFEKSNIMDAGIAFCQTEDERIEGECRLFMMGVRDVEDGRTVSCKIRRDRCWIRSTELCDISKAQVATPHDVVKNPEDPGQEKTRNVRLGEQRIKKKLLANKNSDGTTRKKATRRSRPSKVVE